MFNKILLLVLILSLGVVVRARHVHPHKHNGQNEGDLNFVEYENQEEQVTSKDGIPINVYRHIKPQRFVPINNVFYFKNYPDCEPGYKRDFIGICREVW